MITKYDVWNSYCQWTNEFASPKSIKEFVLCSYGESMKYIVQCARDCVEPEDEHSPHGPYVRFLFLNDSDMTNVLMFCGKMVAARKWLDDIEAKYVS